MIPARVLLSHPPLTAASAAARSGAATSAAAIPARVLLSHPPLTAASAGSCAAARGGAATSAAALPLRLHRKQERRSRSGVCRAEFAQDAPYAAAIGGCILSSVVLPLLQGPPPPDDEDGEITSTDARFAVMGIISFIPYFNWMSWVFAWLDSGRRRYLVYSFAYLIPYLRTNLSINPEDSWLPIASILLCIIHVQLEASIKNGDLNGIKFFVEAQKLFTPLNRKKTSQFESYQGFQAKEMSTEQMELPSVEELRDEFQNRLIPREPVDELHQHLDEKAKVDSKEQDLD